VNSTQESPGTSRQQRQRTLFLVGLGALAVVFLGVAVYIFFILNPSRSESNGVAPLPLGEAPQALRLTVLETGIVSLTSRQIDQTSLPVETITAETLQLTRDGEIIPFYIAEGENNEATLYFYAEAVTNTLEAPAVYWLSPGQGQEMAQIDAAPEGGSPETNGQRHQKWEEY
jgi:hypothetical protein